MRTFKEALTETFMQIIAHYQRELRVTEDNQDVEPRPPGILSLEESILRRELVSAANEGNTELANQITEHLTTPHDLVLFAGFISMIRLEGEKGGNRAEKGHLSTYYLPVNGFGREWLQKELIKAD